MPDLVAPYSLWPVNGADPIVQLPWHTWNSQMQKNVQNHEQKHNDALLSLHNKQLNIFCSKDGITDSI